MRYGVELDSPAMRYTEVEADSLTEAWIRATREFERIGIKVMVVFTADVPAKQFMQAMKLDYSNTTGTGDPH